MRGRETPPEASPDSGAAFGLVKGFEEEWGSFSIREREEVNRSKGVGVIERDLYFEPAPVSRASAARPQGAARNPAQIVRCAPDWWGLPRSSLDPSSLRRGSAGSKAKAAAGAA